jgi:hypothetical protein
VGHASDNINYESWIIGTLSAAVLDEVNDGLKAALDLLG